MKATRPSKATIEKVCQECGQAFLIYRSTLKSRPFTYCSKKCYELNKRVLRGEENPSWKGDGAGYYSLHSWIRRNKEVPNGCELCGIKNAKKYEWANKDHKYKRNKKDYFYVCTSCHRKYDLEHIYKRYKKICKHCGETYKCSVHNRKVSKYCSVDCKWKAWGERQIL